MNREEIIDRCADEFEAAVRKSLKDGDDGVLIKQVGLGCPDREISWNFRTGKTDIIVKWEDPLIRNMWADMMEEAVRMAMKRFSKKDFAKYRH